MELLILALVALGVLLALRHMKRHPNTCGGDCAGCGQACGKRKQK